MNRLAQASSKVDRERLLLNTLTLMHGSLIEVKPFAVRLHFHGDLDFFLGSKTRGRTVERSLIEKTSVKDVIESCGVPHPEVDLIVVNGEDADFDYGVMNDTEIEVYPPEIQSLQFRKKQLQVHTVSRLCHGWSPRKAHAQFALAWLRCRLRSARRMTGSYSM